MLSLRENDLEPVHRIETESVSLRLRVEDAVCECSIVSDSDGLDEFAGEDVAEWPSVGVDDSEPVAFIDIVDDVTIEGERVCDDD